MRRPLVGDSAGLRRLPGAPGGGAAAGASGRPDPSAPAANRTGLPATGGAAGAGDARSPPLPGTALPGFAGAAAASGTAAQRAFSLPGAPLCGPAGARARRSASLLAASPCGLAGAGGLAGRGPPATPVCAWGRAARRAFQSRSCSSRVLPSWFISPPARAHTGACSCWLGRCCARRHGGQAPVKCCSGPPGASLPKDSSGPMFERPEHQRVSARVSHSCGSLSPFPSVLPAAISRDAGVPAHSQAQASLLPRGRQVCQGRACAAAVHIQVRARTHVHCAACLSHKRLQMKRLQCRPCGQAGAFGARPARRHQVLQCRSDFLCTRNSCV